jgi:hypothetical protein
MNKARHTMTMKPESKLDINQQDTDKGALAEQEQEEWSL